MFALLGPRDFKGLDWITWNLLEQTSTMTVFVIFPWLCGLAGLEGMLINLRGPTSKIDVWYCVCFGQTYLDELKGIMCNLLGPVSKMTVFVLLLGPRGLKDVDGIV